MPKFGQLAGEIHDRCHVAGNLRAVLLSFSSHATGTLRFIDGSRALRFRGVPRINRDDLVESKQSQLPPAPSP